MCVDYSKLNKKTVECNYPARLEDLLGGASGCDIFSVIDLRQAYHHIPIKVEDREKTAFVVGARKFEWLRMPFGLHGASFSLAAAMVEILSDCRSFARAYYDHCIVASRGREQHLQHLEKLFQKFSSYCLHINIRYVVKMGPGPQTRELGTRHLGPPSKFKSETRDPPKV